MKLEINIKTNNKNCPYYYNASLIINKETYNLNCDCNVIEFRSQEDNSFLHTKYRISPIEWQNQDVINIIKKYNINNIFDLTFNIGEDIHLEYDI